MNPLVIIAATAALAGGAAYLWGKRSQPSLGPGTIIPDDPMMKEGEKDLPYGEMPALKESFEELSDKLDKLVKDLAKDKRATPQFVATVASEFSKKGFDLTAVQLNENARQRASKLGGYPYVVQQGDTASKLAQTYAGDALRWTELVGRRSSLGLLRRIMDGAGWAQLYPWQVGQTIIMPLNWNKASQLIVPKKDAASAASPAADWAKT